MIRYHPECCREMPKKLLQSGVLNISKFASTNYLSDLRYDVVEIIVAVKYEPLVLRNLARGRKFKQRRHINNQTPR